MMGDFIFLVNEKMCAGVDAERRTGEECLMVWVEKAGGDVLLDRPGCRGMNFTGIPVAPCLLTSL